MSHVRQIPQQDASGDTAVFYAANLGDDGALPNFVKAFSHRPAIYAAWRGLLGALRQTMETRRYELATLAAARALNSSYCCLAHGSVLLGGILTEDELTRIATDHRTAGLPEVEVAVMDLAESVAIDAASVTEAQIQRLRDLGLDEGEICDVIAAAAARAFFSKYVDATGTLPDPKYGKLPADLKAALVVGRPIAET